jgi:uncharacterized metal-binding protein
MNQERSQCAKCVLRGREKACLTQEGGFGPAFCPTVNRTDAVEKSLNAYKDEPTAEFVRQSVIQEGEGYADRDGRPYGVKTRIQEIVEFATRMKYKRLGLAFCSGLHKEAALFSDLLEKQSFDVVSVVCKVGCVPKESLGVQDNEKVAPGTFESTCNPLGQAEVLNEENTQLNIMLGLCVGHDSLFVKGSKAPVTVLAVKDRVTGHNPLAALYTLDSYYRRLKRKATLE